MGEWACFGNLTMKRGGKQVWACDCETDPFDHGAEIRPFIWGLYDGKEFWTFNSTISFVQFVRSKRIILYAHNGGKFDFMFLLPFIEQTKAQIINGRIVSMFLGDCELRDSFSCVPVSMKEIQKDDIDYAKMNHEVRDLHMDEITQYLKSDCVYLWELMTEYRRIAGVQKTIASNALTFAKKKGIDIGRTTHAFDKQFRQWFYGGRTECFQPGTHENISIFDIRSAYPRAMMELHPTGSDFVRATGPIPNSFTREQIQRMFIRLECISRGAFPKRSKGGLSFPHEFDEYFVTGWEYLAALDCGLISNVKIYSYRYTNETIHFRDYVQHWYDYKRSWEKKTNPIQYTIGKIMMNSLYGKTAQNIASYFDYVICPAGTPVNETEGWTLYTENPKHEIHRRESLWKYKYRYGVGWTNQKLYHNVASGASITGYCRAALLRAMHGVGIENVIYCDTDSIICKAGTETGGLAIGPALGEWEIEDSCAPIGYFAGKKLYGIRLSRVKSDGSPAYKIACKGSRLMFHQFAALISGKKIAWKSETPTFHLDGSYDYLEREITATGGINQNAKKRQGGEKKMGVRRSVYEIERV